SIQAENRFSVARFQVLRKGQVLPAAGPGPPGLSGRTLISRVIGPHPAPACWGVSVACQEPAARALVSVNQQNGRGAAGAPPGAGPGARERETVRGGGFWVRSMPRSGAPSPGAQGGGRSAIPPAASQVGAEPCARAFPAARARRNAPVISDNAVVAATINWRA